MVADPISARAYARYLALAAAALVAVVVATSAWLRLSHEGFGCADWPRCYGRVAPSVAGAPEAVPPPGTVAVRLAHRGAAMGVTVANLLLAWLCWTGAVGVRSPRATAALLLGITFALALLGRWSGGGASVPAVTIGNVVGGSTLFAVLCAIAWVSGARPRGRVSRPGWSAAARLVSWLILVEIALGAWLGGAHAEAVCRGFPDCAGVLWPSGIDWGELALFRPAPVDAEGFVVSAPPAIALNLLHRFLAGAIAPAAGVLGLAVALGSPRRLVPGALVLAGVAAASAAGVACALYGQTVPFALAHHLGAVLLLAGTSVTACAFESS